VTDGLAEGHAFLRAVAANWEDPSGPYRDPGAVLMVAFAAQAAVGLAGVVVDPYLAEARTGRLKHVYVAPAWRRQGVADALVAACLDPARGRFDRIRLRTTSPAAARLYERHGFERCEDQAESTHLLVLGRENTAETPVFAPS
jgi:GNAT superfamily N-acetyltransferase